MLFLVMGEINPKTQVRAVSAGDRRDHKPEYILGGTGACSPGKLRDLPLLKWVHMYLNHCAFKSILHTF